MRSDVPKMLHPLAGRPMLLHVLDLAVAVTDRRPLVVIGRGQTAVADLISGAADSVEQAEPRGTGDALRSVPAASRSDGEVLVLSGDVPLLRVDTVDALLQHHRDGAAACTLLTVVPDDPMGMGRILRGADGGVVGIVEDRDLEGAGDAGGECNAGVYVFDGSRLWPALDRVTDANAQGEYYLTDVVAMFDGDVETLVAGDADEAMGINDRRQLAIAEAVLRTRTLDTLMRDGVTIEDPATTYVDPAVRVGRDSVLLPMTLLRGTTRLGAGCVIGPMAQLRDVHAGDRVRIGASALEDCELGDDVEIGHYDRVRPGSVVGDGVQLGTHAELKNSRIGRGSRVSHFSCVLDSDVGEDVNVGAGTVTCNFDGVGKHRTVIGDGAFLGTDSILVAPVRIGARAYVAAGSVITSDVPDGALAVERSKQRNVEGWAARRRSQAAVSEDGA
jgi:bifunctional UDP-N-acetylglucosamine pyrophosphorylase/glucosamine-1-phosphate N-acetyltransferase